MLHNKIKSIACLFDAYLLFTSLYSALVVFVTKSGLGNNVVLRRRPSFVAFLQFLGDRREKERSNSIQPFFSLRATFSALFLFNHFSFQVFQVGIIYFLHKTHLMLDSVGMMLLRH
ncbi:hypothetical protein J3458_017265 [Metarhizium acridum]|uniref:uncharacterized protein n=1 Tax=Metarhizium acridum TaxID=92637 RepID=UPI001C6C4203|nr:hypothetical protein J3458_017265 [Metarhizium acridum]